MGWWKIKSVSSGQIDWGHTKSGMANAIPNQDIQENHYNGDGPADCIGDLMNNFLLLAELSNIDLPTQEEMRRFCLLCQIPSRFDIIQNMLTKAWNHHWVKIKKKYQIAWSRLPYDEEEQAVVNFCVNAYDIPQEQLECAKKRKNTTFICSKCGKTNDYYTLLFEENFVCGDGCNLICEDCENKNESQ